MRIDLTRLASAAALAVLLAACADVPDPVGPIDFDVLPRVSPQAGPAQWFEAASPYVLALPGTVFADHDEVNDRLVFGVENASAAYGVRLALSRMGIPERAADVRVVEPIHQVATLRDRWRPTQAGIQIHFFQFVCSIGFNADDGGERSFITASHCTKRQGGVEDTEYFQPTRSVDNTVIAVEVEDPEYVRGGNCPKGRKCRWSDASRARYDAGTSSTLGAIAMTSGPNNGSLDVTGAFSITSQDNTTTSFDIGATVNKVGRTTGWTQGTVAQTCVHTNVARTNITLFCQTIVAAPNGVAIAQGGDSGSGVFTIGGGNHAELIGILWGATANGDSFVFSPLKQVRDELGPISAVP